MQNTVSKRQMVFILFVTLSTSSVVTIPKTMATSAQHGAWLTILIASLAFGAMAGLIVKLNQMNEGKMLYEYSRELTGKYVAFLIGVFYLAYFFTFSLFYCNSFDLLIKSSFLMKTPVWAMLLAGMPVYGVIAYKGIRNLGRLAEIIGLVFLVVTVILFISMLLQGTFSFILPLYNPADTGKYLIALKDTIEQFIGIEVLLVIPFIKAEKKMAKTAVLALIGFGLFYILDVYGCYAMIGMDEIVYHRFPLVDAIRLVEYQKIEFLQRLDIVYDTIGFMRVFLGKSALYLVIVELLCKMLPKVKRIVIVVIVGAAVTLASVVTIGIKDIMPKLVTMLSVGGIVAAFLIPLMLLVISKVKKNAQKNS